MAEERRRFTRISFGGTCRIEDETGISSAELLDISLKGALIRVDDVDVFEPDKTCELEVVISETPLIALHIKVRMVYLSGDRVGMYFLTTDIDSITHLRRLIELNMGDADKTMEELFLWSEPSK
jgi:hypothetical protein